VKRKVHLRKQIELQPRYDARLCVIKNTLLVSSTSSCVLSLREPLIFPSFVFLFIKGYHDSLSRSEGTSPKGIITRPRKSSGLVLS
jgi:hypothetical protein